LLQVKQRLGDFEIVRPLGRGGMGEVYEAWQFNPPRRVALKVLAPWLADDEKALQRFWREAAFPAQLDHPGIVRIITTGKQDGVAFYTMQLVQGVSLSALMRKVTDTPHPAAGDATDTSTVAFHPSPVSSDLPTPEPWPAGKCPPGLREDYLRDPVAFTVRVGVQAARTLAAAHQQGVLHRDIKPSNLMIDHHSQLYLVDFGLTAALDSAADQSVGGVRGTPLYMSPEQARGERVDQRSDIYCLGVTLYELITGGVGPYAANRDDKDAVLGQVRAGKVQPLRTVAPSVNPALERVIHKAFAFQPRRRYQSAEEFGAALEAVGKPESITPTWTPAGVSKDKRRTRKIALAALAVLLVIGAGLLALRASGWKGGDGPAKWKDDRPATVAGEGPDYPGEDRKERIDNHRLPLLREDFEPVWYRKVSGKGGFQRISGQALSLTSPRPEAGDRMADCRTMLVLDDDPERRPFEFSVEVNPGDGEDGVFAKAGIFFGYRDAPNENADRPPFFLIRVGDKPSPNGNAIVAAATAIDARGSRQADVALLPLWGTWGPALVPAKDNWHRLLVKGYADRIEVTIVGGSRKVIPSAEWKNMPSIPPMEGLSTQGALGIWAEDGTVLFRDAWVSTLAPPK
jgi:serine/threonine protein kinase